MVVLGEVLRRQIAACLVGVGCKIMFAGLRKEVLGKQKEFGMW